MQNGEVVSVGATPHRPCLSELKSWLEDERSMLIPAIQRIENELQRMPRIESALSGTEVPFPLAQRLADIRAGMEECLEILRDQDREWIKGIHSVENLVEISAAREDSGQGGEGHYIFELKTCLEGARDMLMPAVQKAESELQRIRRIEAEFSGHKALSPVTQSLTKIRAGMEECLEILRDQTIEWISRITWIENVAGITAVCQISTDFPGLESLVAVRAERPSGPLPSDFDVVPFDDAEQAGIDKRDSITAAPENTFSKRSPSTRFFFVLAAVLITASLIYLTATQSSRITDLHQYVYTLKNELSASHSANKDLTLKNSDLNHSVASIQTHSDALKDTNSELALELQAANSSLAQSEHDLALMQAANHKMISEVKSKLSEIADTQTELKGALYLSEISKAKSRRSLILNPEWFKPGESTQILHGRLTMRIEKAPGKNSGPGVIVQLSSSRPGFTRDRFNKIFRPQLGIPQDFRTGYHRCSLVLLGSKTDRDGTEAYLIAILRK